MGPPRWMSVNFENTQHLRPNTNDSTKLFFFQTHNKKRTLSEVD